MYTTISQQQTEILKKLSKKNNILSYSRIVLLLVAIYFLYLMMYQKNHLYGFVSLAFIIVFIIVVNIYLKVQSKVAYHKTLKQINTDEISFLEGNHQFNNGVEYQNPQHAFSYDLDLFGSNSIFQFTNRTGTFLGKDALAKSLQEIPTEASILKKTRSCKRTFRKIKLPSALSNLIIISRNHRKRRSSNKKMDRNYI